MIELGVQLYQGNERKSFQGKIIDTEIFTDEKDLPYLNIIMIK